MENFVNLNYQLPHAACNNCGWAKVNNNNFKPTVHYTINFNKTSRLLSRHALGCVVILQIFIFFNLFFIFKKKICCQMANWNERKKFFGDLINAQDPRRLCRVNGSNTASVLMGAHVSSRIDTPTLNTPSMTVATKIPKDISFNEWLQPSKNPKPFHPCGCASCRTSPTLIFKIPKRCCTNSHPNVNGKEIIIGGDGFEMCELDDWPSFCPYDQSLIFLFRSYKKNKNI